MSVEAESKPAFTEEISENEPLELTVHGRTYDLTNWGPTHPGGPLLYIYHGKDCTHVFDAFHSKEATDLLKKFPSKPSTLTPPKQDSESIKPYNDGKSVKPRQILADFDKFRQKLVDDGLFKSNALWFTYKLTTSFALWPLAYFLCYQGYWLLGSICLGLLWQQFGWISHEFNHHSVFENRKINRFFGWFTGPLLLGFSQWWWNDRHNPHHAATNIEGSDPDIDNLPLMAWSRNDVDRATPGQRKFIQYQHFYFWIILPFLNIIWGINSILFVKDDMKTSKHKTYRDFYEVEAIGLVIHYILLVLFFTTTMPLHLIPLYWFICKMFAGATLAFVVFFNHYSCPKFDFDSDAGENFVIMQLITTRNLTPGYLTDWLCGGLNYQIEHHLFPTMPRHNLYETSLRLRQWCKSQNLPYLCSDFLEGIEHVRSHLESHALYAREVVKKDLMETNSNIQMSQIDTVQPAAVVSKKKSMKVD